jgi:hypothetical protein
MITVRVQGARDSFVPCVQEYLNFRGGKFSKIRGAFVDVPYFLSKYDPDALRFYLTATTRDVAHGVSPACPAREITQSLALPAAPSPRPGPPCRTLR